jgi:L,D-peptidoglycan transpeptidase YkuD (ErfK/YbiS/YcfS/YnhG family)
MFTVQLKNPQVVKLVSFIIYTCPKCSLSDKPFIRIFGYHQGTVQVTVISLPTALREKKNITISAQVGHRGISIQEVRKSQTTPVNVLNDNGNKSLVTLS